MLHLVQVVFFCFSCVLLVYSYKDTEEVLMPCVGILIFL